MKISMIRTLLAATAALIAGPALADTLVYNVDGVTIDETGEVKRFTQLVFDDDGVITHVLERGEDRPADIEFKQVHKIFQGDPIPPNPEQSLTRG